MNVVDKQISQSNLTIEIY